MPQHVAPMAALGDCPPAGPKRPLNGRVGCRRI